MRTAPRRREPHPTPRRRRRPRSPRCRRNPPQSWAGAQAGCQYLGIALRCQGLQQVPGPATLRTNTPGVSEVVRRCDGRGHRAQGHRGGRSARRHYLPSGCHVLEWRGGRVRRGAARDNAPSGFVPRTRAITGSTMHLDHPAESPLHPSRHRVARAIPRQLVQSRVTTAPGPAPRLLVVVQLSSDRAGHAARQDCSFAKKRESSPARSCSRPF